MGGKYKSSPPSPVALDFAILAELPDVGSRLGFMDIAPQVKALVTTLNGKQPMEAPKITGNQVSGRVRQLERWGYVKTLAVTPVSDGKGVQITDLGKRALAEHHQ